MTLKGLREGLGAAISKIIKAPFLSDKLINEVIRDIQRALLKADVDVKLVLELSNKIRERVKKEEPPPGFTKRDLALKVIYEEILSLLGGDKRYTLEINKKPFVIMLVGIQGSGKTTSAAKLAYYLKKRGYKVGLVCADNFRPGAYDQLKQLGEKINVPVYGELNAKSSIEIAKRGVEYFKKQKFDVVIVDTAGRHKEESSLLKEMKEIADVIKPDEVMLVLDATMGKMAGIHAKAFHEVTPIGSIFLTKLDSSARGGGALAAIVNTGARIKFIGNGEKIEDIEEFDPHSFTNRLLGMGDISALVERLKDAEISTKELTEAVLSGKITLLDFKKQLEAMLKMGPLRKVFELIPGFSTLPDEVLEMGSDKMKKWLAILNSMTKEELHDPSIINKSRIRRIAKGSGVTTKDVRELLKAYKSMKKYMKTLSRQLSKGILFRKLGRRYAF